MLTPGRWADWKWAAGAFDGPRARFANIEAGVMSIDGLLDLKQNFHRHPHGGPLREKDHADIARLLELRKRALT